jgi:hypothetical protein
MVPDTVSDASVPRDVSDDVITVALSVVPVSVPAAAGAVHGDPNVQLTPLTVVEALTRSALVTSPVAVNDPVTVTLVSVGDVHANVAI